MRNAVTRPPKYPPATFCYTGSYQKKYDFDKIECLGVLKNHMAIAPKKCPPPSNITRSIIFSCMKEIHVSSAYNLMSQYLTDCGRSLMYMRKNKGHKIDPWGTPHTSSAGSDKVESTSTMKLLFVRWPEPSNCWWWKFQKYHFFKKNFIVNCIKSLLQIIRIMPVCRPLSHPSIILLVWAVNPY